MTIEMYDLAAGDERLRFSPYCWRIHMALAHKGLDVKTIPIRFGEKEKIAFSGQKLVPVIRDGETIVSDSWDIAVYLEKTYPERPILMEGEQGKSLANIYRHYMQTRIAPALLKIVLLDIWRACAEEDRAYFRASREKRFGMKMEEFVLPVEEGVKNLKNELAIFRQVLDSQPFVSGSKPAFADYIMFGAFMWARGISETEIIEEDDPVYAWRERMLDLFDGLARNAPGLGA